nr:MBL fold metallo-hydrolase [uncultured Duganella sp.]
MIQSLSNFYERYTNGMYYLGHASALAVLDGKKILFDPIVLSQPYSDAWVFYPPQIVDPRWYEVDMVVVSHIHQDHYDMQFLRALPPQVQVLIVGDRPSFEEDIQLRSGRKITVVAPEQVHEILPGIKFYAVNHESNGIDSSAIIYNDRFCLYHGNDNYLQPASMRKFYKINQNIDVACIPYAYIHWYPFLLEYETHEYGEKAKESARLVNHYMDDCLNNIEILQPKITIPFGANLLIDDGNMRSEINLSVRTPIEFTDYARRSRPDTGELVQPMLAGDYVGVGADGKLEMTLAHAYEAEQYRDAAQAFLVERPQKAEPVDGPAADLGQFISDLNSRLADCAEPIDNIIRMELQHRGSKVLLEIDCAVYRAQLVTAFTPDRPYHHFKVDAVASSEWLNGKRFEEVIGMRRFTVRRVPNLYLPNLLRLLSTVI